MAAGKPALGLLIAAGPAKKPAPGGGEMGMEEDSDMEGKRMAAKALRKAIQSGDDDALYAAFEELMEYCGHGEEVEVEPGEDEE